MKKVLILTNGSQGLFNFRKELLDRLLIDGNELYISTPNDNVEIIQKLEDINCKVIVTDLDRRGINPVKDFFLILKYFLLTKKIKPDIILMYTIKPNLYGGVICRLLKIPYVTTITGIGSLFQKNNLLVKLVKKIYSFSLKKAKCVFFQNKSNLEFFKTNKMIEENYKIVNGSGVNLEKFSFEKPLEKQNEAFIFIGRIMKEKGIEEYLEVSKLIKNKYNNVEFKILGAYEENTYKEQISELEKKDIVKYLGVSKDVRKELEKVHCIINPSWHEGMSNVLLEAGAMKKFLIASDIPGCREIIINGETGFTFEKSNIEDLNNKIEKFINLTTDEYNDYIKKSYDYIKENFDRDKIIKEYLDIIYS
ncbi:glycosyltransferase family 4 protein [Fusobacterium polymorphum]